MPRAMAKSTGAALAALSVGVRRRRRETAEFPLDQLGESQRGAVLQIRSDDLHADRQARLGPLDRRHGRGQPRGRCQLRPYQLVEIGIVLAVDIDAPRIVGRGMVVRIGRRRHDRAQHHIPLPEDFTPLGLQPAAGDVGGQPLAMAQHRTAAALGRQALVVRGEALGSGLRATIKLERPARRDHR